MATCLIGLGDCEFPDGLGGVELPLSLPQQRLDLCRLVCDAFPSRSIHGPGDLFCQPAEDALGFSSHGFALVLFPYRTVLGSNRSCQPVSTCGEDA